MWISNTTGKKDAMLTFAAISFGVVTLNMLLSSLDTITVGTTTVVFKSLDSSMMAVYLGSTFTAYVSRRWTDKKYTQSETGSPLVDMATSFVSNIIPQSNEQQEVALSQIEMQQPTSNVTETSTPISIQQSSPATETSEVLSVDSSTTTPKKRKPRTTQA